MARLGDIATYVNGYAFKPEDWSNTGLPIIRIQDLTGNAYQANRYSGEYDKKYEVNDGDILISWSASLGVYVWKGEKAVLNQHIFKVVFDKANVDKSFFLHQVQNILEMAASQTHGATMKHLTKPIFDALPFYLPPLEEQHRIAGILDKVTSLISLRKEQLAKLDELVKARFVEMMKDASESVRLDNLICPYKAQRCGDGIYPVLSITMHNGLVLQSERFKKEIASTDKSQYKVVPRNKLVVAFPIDEGLLSAQTIVDEGIVSPAYNLYTVDEEKIYPKVLEAILRSDLSIQYYKSKLRGTTLRRRMIPKDDFDSMPIKLSSLVRQKQFLNESEKTEKQKQVVQQSLNTLETLKKSLMQEYFG